jgi:hypothetical protein
MLGRRSGAFGIRAFFFEGEASFEGLGNWGGVLGRDIGGALRGERCFLGVGELNEVNRRAVQRNRMDLLD